MLIFSTRTPARLFYRAEFSHEPFANISFFDDAAEHILFHLSLRFDEGRAVCNRRGETLESWHREIGRRVPLGRSALVEIIFAPPQVTVRLDGREIFTFGGALQRARFPDLDRIGLIDFQGGLIPASLDMDIAHTPAGQGQMRLNARLELRAPHPAGLTVPRLEIAHSETDIPVFSDPGGAGLRADLPGRIWAGLEPEAPLRLRLLEGSREIGTLQLSRAELLDRVAPLLTGGHLDRDPALAARVVEHVRFAGLQDRLDPAGRGGLARIAGRMGAEAFLGQLSPGAGPAGPPATAVPADTAEATLTAALAAAGPAVRAVGPGDDPAPALAALTPPEGRNRLYFYLALTEPFCLNGGFDALRRHALEGGLDGLVPAPGDAWVNSGLLPWLLRAGQGEALCDVMARLEDDRQGWIQTPALAWTVSHLLSEGMIPARLRRPILLSFLRFLRKRGPDYWERTACAALTGAALNLLAARSLLPGDMRRELEQTLLAVYGLSRGFWDQVARRDIALPPRLAAARAAFARLDAADADPAAQEAALRLFDQAGCADVARLRRDLFGPGAVGPGGTAPALGAEGLDMGEAALRQLAAPGAEAPAPGMIETIRETLAACYLRVPQAPCAPALEQACRDAAALLAAARAGADPVADLDSLLPRLRLLSEPDMRQQGLGLGLSLLSGLRRTGADRVAGRLEQGLAEMLPGMTTPGHLPGMTAAGHPAAPAEEPAAPEPVIRLADLARAPAVAQPLRRLDLAADSPLAGLAAAGGDPGALPAPHPALPEDNPLFDTLVTVFSCKPNLTTRIPALRGAWLNRLAELGVPYVIITGDGDGTLSGDILALDAPDDYEGLPQKTLATIAWVRANTGFAHMFKIDDDCFLNADSFFHGLSYRSADYYGRTLTRGVGQMDRVWHMSKSNSDRGRFELDKSPEPSTYCDGGSGYALSRTAMEAALDAAASPEGQALIQASFMEDKLLGDLLSLRGIRPDNTDYRITVRRRETPGGRTVARWENGFYPSRVNPVALIHLDDAADQRTAAATLDSDHLIPPRLWPSYQPVRLGAETNALEMVTGPERLAPAREAPVAVVACMRNEMFMLPAFLAHYRRLGVESFLIADNCSNDGTLEYLADQPDVALFSVDTPYSQSRYGVAWQQALMANLRPNRWSLVADADELLVWQRAPRQTLPELLAEEAFATADAARVFMLDLYPRGSLSEADFSGGNPFAEAGYTDKTPFLETSYGRGPYSDSPTWTSAVRHRLIPGSRAELFVAQKMALLKYSPFMRLSAGLHYVAGTRPAPRELIFGHFKYNADFRRKAQAEVARGQHFNNAEEYRKYLALVSEGRDSVFAPGISLPWQECDFVTARLS